MLNENQISFDKKNVLRCLKCNCIPLFGINYLKDKNNKVLIESICNNNHCDNVDIFNFFNKFESKLYSNKNFDFINFFYCINCKTYVKKEDVNLHDKNHIIKSLKDFDNVNNINECKITMENCKNCLKNNYCNLCFGNHINKNKKIEFKFTQNEIIYYENKIKESEKFIEELNIKYQIINENMNKLIKEFQLKYENIYKINLIEIEFGKKLLLLYKNKYQSNNNFSNHQIYCNLKNILNFNPLIFNYNFELYNENNNILFNFNHFKQFIIDSPMFILLESKLTSNKYYSIKELIQQSESKQLISSNKINEISNKIYYNKNTYFKGKITYNDGSFYLGEFSQEFNCREGYGKILYLNGESYEGEWKNDVFYGFGIYSWPNGDKYIGEWVNSIRQGIGIFICNENIYKGEFKNDLIDGFGIQNYLTGDEYKGQSLKGEREGIGIYKWKNGSEFMGCWKNNKQSGYGILEHDGKKYESEIWGEKNEPVLISF